MANDGLSARRIASLIQNNSSSVVVIEETHKPSIHKSAYGEMDIFLGTRMHSNIFAMLEGVPTLAIAYFPKTTWIMEMLGLGKWTIHAQEVTATLLFQQLEELWDESNSLKKDLKPKMVEAARNASRAVEFIAENFHKIYSMNGTT